VGGIRFSVFSSSATRVELCLFARAAGDWVETERHGMTCGEGWVWELTLPSVGENTAYAYRLSGVWDPVDGYYSNPNKILLDPYARALAREPRWHSSLLAFSGELMSEEDSGGHGPLAAILPESNFDWGEDRLPRIPWEQTIIYEAHTKGLTQLFDKVPAHLRGTYLGLVSEPVIDHLRELGITSIELLPVHAFFDEFHLHSQGKTNYWGYNTLNYFSPSLRYSRSAEPARVLDEFKEMVRAFHKSGFEVLLDVVYNHTCEGNERGPILSLRGLDNREYYRSLSEERGVYEDFSGCGNTLDVRHPMALKLVLDSLRYWISEMHIDGFRFDLTSALIHDDENVNLQAPFLLAIAQDPLISNVKLIAEPWDCSFGGYMVGRFPSPWRDWNGQFRDSARAFWRGDEGRVGSIASRLAGSSDFFSASGRLGTASVNFVTAHDGFTLQDLVSYGEKHNLENGEENRDGENNNYSFNCGVEGRTEQEEILALREQQKRNLLAMLLAAKGVPMLVAGDELSRTQGGNNNPYCLDSETSWVSWELNERSKEFLEFTKSVIELRKNEPLLRGLNFFSGELMEGSGQKDVTWLSHEGTELAGEAWNNPANRALGMRIVSPETSAEGLLLLFNAAEKGVDFAIPTSCQWEILLDTSVPAQKNAHLYQASYYPLAAKSMCILKQATR